MLFQIKNKEKRSWFYEKTFWLAFFDIDIIENETLLILGNIEINFNELKLFSITYSFTKVILFP